MTFGTILKSVLGPSSWQYFDYPTATESQKLLSERNAGGADYYHYGHYKKSKGKSKSDKKHAILSALTLLAFLFFLNVLQSCIREQNQNREAVMMFTPVQQGKNPEPAEGSKEPEFGFRTKRSVDSTDEDESNRERRNKTGKEHVSGRKSRTLLEFNQQPMPRETTAAKTNRQTKFIRHYSGLNNWTRELTQVSDKDLEDQKLKTLNFPLYWKNNRFASTELRQSTVLPTVTVTRVVESPILNGRTVPPTLRRIKKRERTTGNVEQNATATAGTPSPTPAPQKSAGDLRHPTRRPEWFQGNRFVVEKENKDFRHPWFYNKTQDPHNNTWQGFTKSHLTRESTQVRREATTMGMPQMQKTIPTTQRAVPVANYVVTTPRNRRSEYGSTARPTDYDDYERYSEQTREDLPATTVGLDLNTYQTFPVYNYYNHRHNANLYRENQTADVVPAEPSVKPEMVEIDRIHNEVVRVTTEPPLFHPTKTAPMYRKPPFQKYRNRYPNNHGYHYRNYYPIESRYRYSPYRKTGTYEPGHFHDHDHHDDYYSPALVVAKYPQDEEPGFDLMKFLWTMFTSFARPLTKLVPSFAKDNNEEPQCYDLLVCEAQRVSRFMGPTAEALATTVGTLLTWAATEETRQIVVDAINSGRENTCQQQIRDCEDRSGGKSAMTVIAQVMEMKLR